MLALASNEHDVDSCVEDVTDQDSNMNMFNVLLAETLSGSVVRHIFMNVMFQKLKFVINWHSYHESRRPDEDLVICMIREIPAVGWRLVDLVCSDSWTWLVRVSGVRTPCFSVVGFLLIGSASTSSRVVRLTKPAAALLSGWVSAAALLLLTLWSLYLTTSRRLIIHSMSACRLTSGNLCLESRQCFRFKQQRVGQDLLRRPLTPAQSESPDMLSSPADSWLPHSSGISPSYLCVFLQITSQSYLVFSNRTCQ